MFKGLKLKKNTQTSILIMVVIVLSFIMINTNLAFANLIPPKPNTNIYVFDYADIIEDADEQEMRKVAKIINDKTQAQIVVVTVNELSQMTLEDYSLRLFRNWE